MLVDFQIIFNNNIVFPRNTIYYLRVSTLRIPISLLQFIYEWDTLYNSNFTNVFNTCFVKIKANNYLRNLFLTWKYFRKIS